MKDKLTMLMILDGFGENTNEKGNAVKLANTPNIDKIMKLCPTTDMYTSGLNVGLPDGQMGNSEVGHLNIGAGRIVYQELTRITKSIEDGDFFSNPEFINAIENCKKYGSKLHIMGLLSDGGVHSHIRHIFGLLELAKRKRFRRCICTLFYGWKRHSTCIRRKLCIRTRRKDERKRNWKNSKYIRKILCNG